MKVKIRMKICYGAFWVVCIILMLTGCNDPTGIGYTGDYEGLSKSSIPTCILENLIPPHSQDIDLVYFPDMFYFSSGCVCQGICKISSSDFMSFLKGVEERLKVKFSYESGCCFDEQIDRVKERLKAWKGNLNYPPELKYPQDEKCGYVMYYEYIGSKGGSRIYYFDETNERLYIDVSRH